jgi:hypothetical protein
LRLYEIPAAILRVKLKHLDKNNNRRNEIAQFYCENIINNDIILPVNKDFFTITFKKFKAEHKSGVNFQSPPWGVGGLPTFSTFSLPVTHNAISCKNTLLKMGYKH